MPKNKLSEYSATAADNTDIGGINIAEGMAPSDVNNAMREQMSQLKEFIDGSSGDTVTTAKIVATTATILSGASVTGIATFNSGVVMSSTLSNVNVSNASTFNAAVNFTDNDVQRPKLLDYAIKGSALGNTGTAATVNFESANFFSATSTAATTWAFTNPVASGDFCGFVLELTNGGAYTQAWPASVDWPGGTAPTLTASGKDQLVFTTRDAGTTYFGFAAGLDIK
jgi:hypothetical protein